MVTRSGVVSATAEARLAARASSGMTLARDCLRCRVTVILLLGGFDTPGAPLNLRLEGLATTVVPRVNLLHDRHRRRLAEAKYIPMLAAILVTRISL